MRSIQHSLSCSIAALACVLVAALLAFTRVDASPLPRLAVGGDWRSVEAPALSAQRITALLPDGRGGLWVGTEERGLIAWNGEAWRAVGSRDGLPDSRIVALFLDDQRRLWVSTGSGIGYFPPDGGLFRRTGLKGLQSLPVLAFAQTADGAILLGSATGLDRWQADGAVQRVSELTGSAVSVLYSDHGGVIWAGTSTGLWRFLDGKWQREDSIGECGVASIVGQEGGDLYVAARSGLWRGRAGAWRQLSPPTAGTLTAVAARDGTVWVGTFHGVAAGQAELWETYDPVLLPNATVTTMAWDADGALWVGTAGGLAAYRPDPNPPQITIAAVNGQPPDSGYLQLASDRVDHIQLAVSDAVTPLNSLHIFTRLQGIDVEPRLLGHSSAGDVADVSIYADRILAPGSYVLRAWAQDDAFNRSPETQVTIIVPQLARGPGGLLVRQVTVYAGLAGLALMLAAGATAAAAGSTRRRQAEHAAQDAAASVRAVADRRAELYSTTLALREQQVQESIAVLRSKNVLLLGGPGLGKTITLGQLVAVLPAASDRTVSPAPIDLAVVSEQDFFRALMTTAAAALHPLVVGAWPRLRWNQGHEGEYGEQEFSADLGLLLSWLRPQFSRRLLLVFLLDNAGAVDEYDSRKRDAFRRLIVAASATDSPVRLVLAAQQPPDVTRGFADLFHTVLLSPLAPAAAAQLLRGGTEDLLEWESEAERAAVTRAAGVPANVAAIGRAAANAALSANRLRIAAADVP